MEVNSFFSNQEVVKTFYDEIEKLCERNDMTIAKLERELKFSNATIRRWKHASPSVANVKRVADYFGVTIDSLISGDHSHDR